MTNFTTRMMIAAATVVVAAGSASAQVLKAEVPFPFRTDGVVMQAGAYRIDLSYNAGTPRFQLRSDAGGHSVLLIPTSPGDPQKDWAAKGDPLLTFECGIGHCVLSGIWPGPTSPAYRLPHPKMGKDEPVRTAVVLMRSNKSE